MTGRLGAPLLAKLAGGLALLLALALAVQSLRLERRGAALGQVRAELAAAQAEQARFAAAVRAASEAAARRFAEQARRAERRQAEINEETSHDYQTRLSALRRRAAALRAAGAAAAGRGVQPGPAGADRGSAGAARMPGPAGAAGGADGAAGDHRLPGAGLALDERLAASEQALRLVALQAWVRAQRAAAEAE